MLYCDPNSLAREAGHVLEIVALPCRCWGCESCVHLNKRRLQQLARDGRPDTFVTLTLPDDDSRSHDEQARQLVDALKRLVDWAQQEAMRDLGRRRQPRVPEPRDGWPRDRQGRVPRQVRLPGAKLAFLAVLEDHKSGKPHLHLIARSHWIAVEWLREAWRELTGAHRVQIGRPRSIGGIAFYVSKYLSKAPRKYPGCKRYWRSKDWQVVERDKSKPVADHATVTICMVPARQKVHETLCRGYRIHEHRPGYWLMTAGGVPP